MNTTKQNPTLFQMTADNHLDYSEMYRTQEMKQLNKRLRKTRNVLLVCAASLLIGALVFWSVPNLYFTTKSLLIYTGLAAVMALLSAYSSRQPYFSALAALLLCLGLWVVDLFVLDNAEILIEGSIQKLFIVSLLIWCFHTSREAELIRKELHFS